MKEKLNIITYNNGEIELKVSVKNDTIWLTQKQLAELFEVSIPNINMHIKAIFKEKELEKNSTVKKFLIVQKEGNREVTRNVEHYNLDMIISIGYRVNSLKATKFRQWATSVLKQYISNGYVINSDKITNNRFVSLEKEVHTLKLQISNITNQIEDNTLKIKQGIFYNGQIFDAYIFVSDLVKSAKNSIVLIDNYIDESTLNLFTKNQAVSIVIYTRTISNQLQQDIDKYNSQFRQIIVKNFKDSHDRFLIIDDELYHIGASLKDLGKKIFGFSKMDKSSLVIPKEDKLI